MYEKVLVVGVKFIPPHRQDQWGVVRTYTYNERGVQRNWDTGFPRAAGHAEEKETRYRLDRMPNHSMGHLLGAAGIEADDYQEMYLAVQEGNYERAFAAERTIESRALQMIKLSGGALILDETEAKAPKDERRIARKLIDLVVGKIVRIDWRQEGRWGKLESHPLAILPSADNGSDMFAGKSVDEWLDKHEQDLGRFRRGAATPQKRDPADVSRAAAALEGI